MTKKRRKLKPIVKQVIVGTCIIYASVSFMWNKVEDRLFYPTPEAFLDDAVEVNARVVGWDSSREGEDGKKFLTINYGDVYKEILIDEHYYSAIEGQETIEVLYSPKYVLMVLDAETLEAEQF